MGLSILECIKQQTKMMIPPPPQQQEEQDTVLSCVVLSGTHNQTIKRHLTHRHTSLTDMGRQVQVQIHTDGHTRMHTLAQMYSCTHTDARMHTDVQMRTQRHTHAHTHTDVQMRTQRHTHAHTHTDVQMRTQRQTHAHSSFFLHFIIFSVCCCCRVPLKTVGSVGRTPKALE